MIKVAFTEPKTPEWAKWKNDGEKATAAHILIVKKRQKIKINESLYKRMRGVFYGAFNGKCGYCERKFVLDQSGDIDHFRPKAKVVDEKDRVVKIRDKSGKKRQHPGYYWLAYDWRNLLPTCSACNRLSKNNEGVLVGKGTRFPVEGAWAGEPGGEAREKPWFLHPIFDNPQNSLDLDVKTGVIHAKSKRGHACIDLLDLNREGLPEERRKRYTELQARIAQMVSELQLNSGEKSQETLRLLRSYREGKEELSWAGRKAITDNIPILTQIQKALEP